jgi:hypothetical protein
MTPHEPCGRREAILARRNRVFDLRIAGHSNAGVVRALAAEGITVGETTVRKDVAAELAKRSAELEAKAGELRALEVARLDRLERKLSAKLGTELTNHELIRFSETLVRVSESRRRLLGLDLGGGSTFNTINTGAAGITFNIVRDGEPAAVPVVSRVVDPIDVNFTPIDGAQSALPEPA